MEGATVRKGEVSMGVAAGEGADDRVDAAGVTERVGVDLAAEQAMGSLDLGLPRPGLPTRKVEFRGSGLWERAVSQQSKDETRSPDEDELEESRNLNALRHRAS